jgi:hypothetical protein
MSEPDHDFLAALAAVESARDEYRDLYREEQALRMVLENALWDAEHYLSDIEDDDDVSVLRRRIMDLLSPTKEADR